MQVVFNSLSKKRLGHQHLLKVKKLVPESILFFQEGVTFIIKYREILFCKAAGNYTKVVYSDNKFLLISQCISDVCGALPNTMFVRTHKSYVININHIRAIYKQQVELINGTKIPIARRRKGQLQSLFGRLHGQ